MTKTTCHISISLDGFVAGPEQSRDNPLGVGGRRLHTWHLDEPRHEADIPAERDLLKQRGGYVMGRNMFGPIRGPWSGDWRGWWGEDPPYHGPVFVLTSHARESIEMSGGTTFYFVTDGFHAAMERAQDAADDRDIRIAGGASTVRQALAANVIDDIYLDIIPVALGSGESIFDEPSSAGFTQLNVTHSNTYTHIHYRVG